MADSFRFSKGRKSSKRVNDLDSHGESVSVPIHMFYYDLPVEGYRQPEAVGLCLAAVPPDEAVRDWARVTCKTCLRKRKSYEKARAAAATDTNRNKCAEQSAGRPSLAQQSPPPTSSRAQRSEAVSEPTVLTLEEAAHLLRFSKAHLLNLVHGQVRSVPPLPHIQVGRRIMIRRASLERWLEAVETRGDRTA